MPEELVTQELEALRESVAELVPAGDRPAKEGDTLVVDIVSPEGEAQRDTVVELGSGRLVEEVEAALVGASAGDTKSVAYELADESTSNVDITVKEISEKVLPELDDELASQLGRITNRLVRIIEHLPHVGRVHVNRWGDGGSHLHQVFFARTARLGGVLGSPAMEWDDIIPAGPEDVWRADLHTVATKLANWGGDARA